MKSAKIFLMVIFLMAVCGCASLPNLPEPKAVGLYERGAHIVLNEKSSGMKQGELIAVESGEIILLEQGKDSVSVVPQSAVKKFKVYNAKPRHYGWFILAGSALTGLHGWYLILTLPLNLLVTVPVTLGGENAFTFNNRNTTYEELRMYARFPQGIPAGVERGVIR